jgi:hypothetical protein
MRTTSFLHPSIFPKTADPQRAAVYVPTPPPLFAPTGSLIFFFVAHPNAHIVGDVPSVGEIPAAKTAIDVLLATTPPRCRLA